MHELILKKKKKTTAFIKRSRQYACMGVLMSALIEVFCNMSKKLNMLCTRHCITKTEEIKVKLNGK